MKPLPQDHVIRWGILGAGKIAATVVADIVATPGNTVVAVASRDADRALQFGREHGIARAYGTYADLVADADVDVVYIATTHAQHHEQALLTLRAGKPVLVEKAFTLNARQAREVVAEAEAQELFCMEAMWLRCNQLILSAVYAVSQGTIGTVRGVRAELCRTFPFDPAHRLFDLSVGGGALLDLGVYPLNLAWMFLGAPASVWATGTRSATGSDSTVALQLGYASGAFAQLACSAEFRSDPVALVSGTRGSIELHGAIHRPTRLVINADGRSTVTDAKTTGNGYVPEIEEVAACLRAGVTQSAKMPLSDTIAILDLIDDVRNELGVRYAADDAGSLEQASGTEKSRS